MYKELLVNVLGHSMKSNKIENHLHNHRLSLLQSKVSAGRCFSLLCRGLGHSSVRRNTRFGVQLEKIVSGYDW